MMPFPLYIEAALMMKDSDIKIYREQLLYIAARLITEEKFAKAREVVNTAIEIMPDNDHARRLLLMLDDAAVVDSLIKQGIMRVRKRRRLPREKKTRRILTGWGFIIGSKGCRENNRK